MTDLEEEPQSKRLDHLDLLFVGPATAPLLDESEIDPSDLRERRVSYRQLVEAGVNPGVAGKLRREFSLPWSLAGFDSHLDRRSRSIRGLSEAEKLWVARSEDEWEVGPADVTPSTREDDEDEGYGATLDLAVVGDGGSQITPLSNVEWLSEDAIDQLANAGITTVRRLATIDPEPVAEATGLSEGSVRSWREQARAQR